MNKKDKNRKTSLTVAGAVAVMLLSFAGAASELGEGFFVVILTLAIGVFAVWAAAKKTAQTKKKEQSLEERFTPRVSNIPDCDYGELNCDFSHDHESRISQLDSFLKNGIIDRAEYNVLLKKYTENYKEHKE